MFDSEVFGVVKMSSEWEEIIKLRELKTFPLVDGVHDGRLVSVYPIMQQDVQRMLHECEGYNIELVVFGSSLTMMCNAVSDIDVSIRTAEYDIELFESVQRAIQLCTKHSCDVIYFNDLQENDKILNEILTKGLVLKELK